MRLMIKSVLYKIGGKLQREVAKFGYFLIIWQSYQHKNHKKAHHWKRIKCKCKRPPKSFKNKRPNFCSVLRNGRLIELVVLLKQHTFLFILIQNVQTRDHNLLLINRLRLWQDPQAQDRGRLQSIISYFFLRFPGGNHIRLVSSSLIQSLNKLECLHL